MTAYAAAFRDFIAGYAADAAHTPGEQATEEYTGAGHVHHGISVPDMRSFLGDWLTEHKSSLSYDDWVVTLDTLYRGESVEEKMMAGMLIAQFPRYQKQLPLTRLDTWLDQLHGWMEVDTTCQSVFKDKVLLADWDGWQMFLRGLATNSNINKRRASLVFLVQPVRTPEKRFVELALELVDQLKHEDDKLITKAISWVLRESVKQHKADINAYLDANEDSLPAIAVRETHKKLTTGKK